MSKLKEQWAKYVATVPGFDDAVLDPPKQSEDSDVEYDAFVGTMPTDIVESLNDSSLNQPEEVNWAETVEHHWCLCEMPEGDFPRVFAFPNLQRLVEATAKREGQETAVWAMYGVPLRLTKAVPNPKKDDALTRYLLLPNQLAAVVSSAEAYRLVDQSVLPDNLEIQEEGWLGDPDMLQDQNYYMEGIVDDADFPDEDSPGSDDEGLGYIE